MFSDKQGGYQDLEAGGGVKDYAAPVDLEKQHRIGFIRKVYGILTFQLLVTVAMSALMMFNPAVSAFVLTHSWPYYTAMVLTFVLLIFLFCFQNVSPVNMILLTLWTICIGYTVGLVCALYQAVGYGDLILQAAAITMGIFLGLTLFTLQSKVDWSFLGAGLFSALWGLIILGFIISIFGMDGGFMGALYSWGGAVVFSLYIIFDTYLLMSKYTYDQYIPAAINLYLDIINLFLFILRILAGSKRD
mmetsp:Transcript_20366/g.37925  ORF Transcript_20366/g.37925 Transcript_20366/m.37925 type:complete len:246 (-) Transcript_20366:37-774(-)